MIVKKQIRTLRKNKNEDYLSSKKFEIKFYRLRFLSKIRDLEKGIKLEFLQKISLKKVF